MQREWAKLSARRDVIHAEFAHFSSLDFFELFEKHAVMHADSLGLNEQELFLLLDYWEGKLEVISAILHNTIEHHGRSQLSA